MLLLMSIVGSGVIYTGLLCSAICKSGDELHQNKTKETVHRMYTSCYVKSKSDSASDIKSSD